MTAMLTLCVWLQPIGVIRAFGFLDALLDQYDLSADVRDLEREHEPVPRLFGHQRRDQRLSKPM